MVQSSPYVCPVTVMAQAVSTGISHHWPAPAIKLSTRHTSIAPSNTGMLSCLCTNPCSTWALLSLHKREHGKIFADVEKGNGFPQDSYKTLTSAARG